MKKFYKKTKKKIVKLIHNEYAPVVVVLVVGILFGAGYFGVKYWNNIKQERQIAFELQNEQQKELEIGRLEQDLQDALKEKSRDEEIEALKQQLLDLQNKPSDTKTVTLEAKDNVSSLVKEWSPRVAHLECKWYDSNGTYYGRSSGSATLINFSGLGLRAVTNKHIIVYNKILPRDCIVDLVDGSSYTVPISASNVTIGSDADWAYVNLPKNDSLAKITNGGVKTCKSVDVGDKLLVLGYPKIGSKTGLTVTEGIVSGNDKDYYITSAKIDKGNSGGASILVKDNCYLGIPSASVVGSIESLGRILKASFVIGG